MQSLHRKFGLLVLVPVVAIILLLVVISYRTAPRADVITDSPAYQLCVKSHAVSSYYTPEKIAERCRVLALGMVTPSPSATITLTPEFAISPEVSVTINEVSPSPSPEISTEVTDTTTLDAPLADTLATASPSPAVVISPPITTTVDLSPGKIVEPDAATISATQSKAGSSSSLQPPSPTARLAPLPPRSKDLRNEYRNFEYISNPPANNFPYSEFANTNYTRIKGGYVYNAVGFANLQKGQGYTTEELVLMCLQQYDSVYGKSSFTKQGEPAYNVYEACKEVTSQLTDPPQSKREFMEIYMRGYGTDNDHTAYPATHCITIFNDAAACRDLIMKDKNLYDSMLREMHTQYGDLGMVAVVMWGHLPADEALEQCTETFSSTPLSYYLERGIDTGYGDDASAFTRCRRFLAGVAGVPQTPQEVLDYMLRADTPEVFKNALVHACDADPVNRRSDQCILAANRFAAYRAANPDVPIADLLKYVYTQDDLFTNNKQGTNAMKQNPKRLAGFINEVTRHINNHYTDSSLYQYTYDENGNRRTKASENFTGNDWLTKNEIRTAIGIDLDERTFREKAGDWFTDGWDALRNRLRRPGQ